MSPFPKIFDILKELMVSASFSYHLNLYTALPQNALVGLFTG